MSVRPHPRKGIGWWVIDYYSSGRKGKRIMFPFQGTKGAALALEQDLRRSPGDPGKLVSPLIRDLVSPWLEHYRESVSQGTYKDAANSLAHLLPVVVMCLRRKGCMESALSRPRRNFDEYSMSMDYRSRSIPTMAGHLEQYKQFNGLPDCQFGSLSTE